MSTNKKTKNLKLLHPYCACHTKKEMHSRDTIVLIDLLWFNVVETLTIGIKSSDQEICKGDDQAQQEFTGLFWVIIKNQGLYKSEIKQSRQWSNFLIMVSSIRTDGIEVTTPWEKKKSGQWNGNIMFENAFKI